MVYEDRAWAILGSVHGTATHLAEQVVAKARLPLVSPVSTDESVNLAGVPWMFSVAPADHLWAPVLAENLAATADSGAFALIAVTDHDSRLATEAVLDALIALDRAPSYRLDLRPDTTELDSSLARLNLAELTSLLLVAGPEDGARLLRQLRTFGFEGTVFASPSLSRRLALERAGAAAEGLRLPLLWAPRPGSASSQTFERLFRKRTGFDPDWATAHTYDATRLLLDAIRTAGPSRAGIRQVLVELSPWRGVTGRIEWDPTGQNMRPVTTMATVRDGRLSSGDPASPPEAAGADH
jgi:ABC-type branched-subunit amino acid transport system substrate-binding protein